MRYPIVSDSLAVADRDGRLKGENLPASGRPRHLIFAPVALTVQVLACSSLEPNYVCTFVTARPAAHVRKTSSLNTSSLNTYYIVHVSENLTRQRGEEVRIEHVKSHTGVRGEMKRRTSWRFSEHRYKMATTAL